METPIALEENLRLADLIDAKAIQSMMDDFYRVASIPMSIIDLQGEVLVGIGWQRICSSFHRAHPSTFKHCMESDLRLSADIPIGQFRIYRCLNHMWDIATPIVVCGRHMGNVFSGQFFFDDEPVDVDLFRSQARKNGFDEKEYLAALEEVPRLSRDRVHSGMSFFVKIADFIASSSYSNMTLARSLRERDTLMLSLAQSRHDLNKAQAVAHTGSWRQDVLRNELTWSDETHRIFGIPKGTPLTYEMFLGFIHPLDREVVAHEWSSALRGQPYDVEHRILVGDTVKWVREKAELEFNEDGSLRGGFGTVQDITERKLAEANRSLLTDTLRILCAGGDLHTLIAETLALIRAATGFDAVGLRLRQGEDCPYFEQNGFSEEFLREENFLCNRGPDGEVLRDPQGGALLECTCGLVLSGRTDPSMPCFTRAGSFWTNASHELLGLEPEADPRLNPRNRCIHSGFESVGLFPLRAGGEMVGLLHLNGRKEGLFTPELIDFFETLAQNIGLTLQRTLAEDSLQKAHAQLQDHARRLEETNRELEGFAYTISHDFRAPLRAINSFARMISDDCGPSMGDEGRRRLSVIEGNAIRMGLLIDDLLAFSRAGRTEMRVSRVNMNRLVADVVETLRKSVEHHPRIHVADLPAARGDAALIRQVVSNLVGNGLKFTRNSADPKIEIGCVEQDGAHVYFVKDNGIGFNMKYQDKLFGVFNRLVSEKDFEGNGAGLAIVQRLVTRHGGRVWAEAKPGEGATFFFNLESAPGGLVAGPPSCSPSQPQVQQPHGSPGAGKVHNDPDASVLTSCAKFTSRK